MSIARLSINPEKLAYCVINDTLAEDHTQINKSYTSTPARLKLIVSMATIRINTVLFIIIIIIII